MGQVAAQGLRDAQLAWNVHEDQRLIMVAKAKQTTICVMLGLYILLAIGNCYGLYKKKKNNNQGTIFSFFRPYHPALLLTGHFIQGFTLFSSQQIMFPSLAT